MQKNINWANHMRIGPENIQRHVDSKEVESPLDNLDIYAAGISDITGEYDISRPNFFCHVVFFTLEGAGEIETPNFSKKLEKGSIMIVPSGQAARYYLKDKYWKFLWFDILNTHKRDWLRLDSVVLKQSTEEMESLYSAMESLYKEIHRSKPYANRIAELLCEQINIYLERELHADMHSKEDENLKKLNYLFKIVETRLGYDWNIKSLSKELDISSPYLYALCKEHLKSKPMKLVTNLRMKRAKELLELTRVRIQDIAYSIGYQNPLNFSTAFKKHTGLSPRAFRKE